MNSFVVGELRRSQAVHTFGIGSCVDLPFFSAVVLGLEQWRQFGWEPDKPESALHEPRLLGILKSVLGPQLEQLTALPICDEDADASSVAGVPLATFPRWFRCSQCELAAPVSSGVFKLEKPYKRPEDTRYIHEGCSKFKGKRPPVVSPVRFVHACRNGHLNDFPWKHYISGSTKGCGGANPNCCSSIYLQERGVAAEVADIWAKCASPGCEAAIQMIHAFDRDKDVLGPCSGHHPHLGRGHREDCVDADPRAMLLGASNQWFPIMVSALWLPASGDDLANAIEAMWPVLAKATDRSRLDFLDELGQLAEISADWSLDEIWDGIEWRRSDVDEDVIPTFAELKTTEWELFADPANAPLDDDFRIHVEPVPERYAELIAEVVAVDRLRLVKAITSFTRIDSPGDYADPTEIDPVQRVDLGNNPPTWLPAFEVKGEGLFIRFPEDAIDAWRSKPTVRVREQLLHDAHVAFRRVRDIEPHDDGFDVLRFTLLHTLAHLLIRQLSIDCGYSAASIQERIYSRNASEVGGPMAGVLLMTAAPDSEGTLGGLVELAKPEHLGRHLYGGIERATLCASDPLCSEHEPIADGRTLHGACCHACGYVSETSCERGNKYLDRALLVPVIGADVEPYFGATLT